MSWKFLACPAALVLTQTHFYFYGNIQRWALDIGTPLSSAQQHLVEMRKCVQPRLMSFKLRLLWKPATLYPASNKDWKLEILCRVSAASTADLVTCIDTHWWGFCFWGSLRPGVSTDISLGWEMSLLGRWLEVSAGEAALLLKLHPLAHLVSLDQAAKLWSVLVVGYH